MVRFSAISGCGERGLTPQTIGIGSVDLIDSLDFRYMECECYKPIIELAFFEAIELKATNLLMIC